MPKLIVKNFIHTREAELDMDKKLVVLIGEQASGKSTLAQLLYFFHNVTYSLRKWLWEVNWEGEQQLVPTFQHHFARQFRLFFGELTHLGPFEITYHYTDESAVTLALTDDGQLDITLPALTDELNEVYKEYQAGLRKAKEKSLKEGTSQQANTFTPGERMFLEIFLGTGIRGITERFFGTQFRNLYIPASRQIISHYPDAFKRVFYGGIKRELFERDVERNPAPAVQSYLLAQLLEKNEEFLQTFNEQDYHALLAERVGEDDEDDEDDELDAPAAEFLMEKMARILKGTYGTADDKKSLFNQPTGEGSVPLLAASAGEQNTLRLLQDIFFTVIYNDTVFRVIEEPEASLYPTAQKELIECIALLLNTEESQVVLTTHSPYVLTVLQTLLRAAPAIKKHPSVAAAARIAKLAPDRCWLSADEVAVYELKDGTCHSLIDAESEEILRNPLAAFLTEFSLDISE